MTDTIAEYNLTKRLGENASVKDLLALMSSLIMEYLGYLLSLAGLCSIYYSTKLRKVNCLLSETLHLKEKVYAVISLSHFVLQSKEYYPRILRRYVWGGKPTYFMRCFQMAIKKSYVTSSLLKGFHNIFSTQVYTVKLNQTIYSQCPCCPQAPVDIHHVLICPK
jgi:hypothetical protein